MHSIVGASVSSNAMDAQARAERVVQCGWCGAAGAAWLVRPKPSGLVMAEKRKLEFDSLSGVC